MSEDRIDLPTRTLRAFAILWAAQAPPTGLTAMPRVVARSGGFRPANQEPFLELDVLMDQGSEWGPVGMKTYDLPGLVQISVQVQSGKGDLGEALVRIAAECLNQISVRGLSIYGCRMPYELPVPLAGYYGLGIDAPAHYAGP
jgi:hypothetical protein